MTEAGRITALIDGDISGLSSALNQARSQATSAVSGIEGDFKKGFGSGLQSSISGVTSSMGPLGSAISGVTGGLGLAATAGLAGVAALGALGAQAVSTAANWESLMASVSKTTGVEGSGLDQLSSDLQEIRMETGATAEEIANAVTTAGSVGIPKEELAGFSEVALQMGSAFSMSSDAAVSGISAIGNSAKDSGTSWTDFATQAGSSVNVLADSMRTSEEQILTGMTHLGATMGLLKPPEDTVPAWMALVATVQSLGLAGDQAGEAIQDALTYAAKNAESKDLGIDVAGLLGVSEQQLQLDLRTNAPEVLQDVATAIADLPLEDQAAAMAMFGSTGSKAIALLMGDLDKSTGKFDKLGTAIEDSNKAWAEGTSLSTAYAASQETFNAATDRLGASLDVAGQKLGTVFLPALTSGVGVLADGVDLLIGFGEAASNLFTSDFSGLWGSNKEDMYQGIVDKKRAAEAGEEVGDAIGEGVEGSDLAEAPGKTLSSSDAKDAVGDAAKESAKEFSKEWLEEFETQQADREIAKILARSGALSQNKGNVSGYVSTSLENGLDINVAYQGNGKSIMSRLFIDGQQIGDAVYGANREKSIRKLLEGSGLGYDQGNVLDLTGKAGEAAIWRLNQSQDVIIDSYLDISASMKSELEGAGQEIGDAFAEGIVPDIAAIESRLENLRRLKLYDPEEAKKQGADNAIAYLDALGNAVESYDKAKLQYIMDPDNEKAKEDLLTARDNLQQILDQNPLEVPVTGDFSMFNTAMDNVAGSVDLADILADPSKFKEQVMNIPEFMENTFQPKLEDQIDFFKTQWHSGITGAQQETEDFLQGMLKAASEMPSLFKIDQLNILYAYKLGLIDTKAAIDALANSTKEASTETKNLNVGWNALQNTLKDDDGCECVLSDFAKWQEAQTDLFQGAYIGPGGSAYLTWKQNYMTAIAETQAAMKAVGGAVLGQDYTQQVQEIKTKVSIDTTTAKTDLTTFVVEVEKERMMPLKIDDTSAKATIAGIDEAASKPVTKIVYVQEVSSGSGGSSTYTPNKYYGNYGHWYDPIGFANEGYIASPTLAIVGDRPGGEYVVGAARFEAAASRINNKSDIVINYSPMINGSNLSADELSRILEEHDEKLIAKIAEAKEWS
ncbi:phage tail tape measure protein [Candidatus Pacearchaeota archaeon]|jgi:TP901 family phage tail tape measure protein|nr:phage tail tape measure protein [Candidatus Pacearchaeota archaeon]